MLVAVPAQVHQAVQVAAAVWVATLEEQRLQGKVMQVVLVGQHSVVLEVHRVAAAGRLLLVQQVQVGVVVMAGQELHPT
jgi:hypothetical protein